MRTPARLAGLHWSEPSLPGDIVFEAVAEPGALRLVGNLLRLLWDERDGNVLSAKLYRELGRLGGALAKRADLLLDGVDKEVRNGRDRAKQLLLELVEPGHGSQDSRRTITREMALAAAGGGQEAEVVLNRLSGPRGATTPRGAKAMPRLVVVSGAAEGANNAPALVDLAHEALLRDDRHGQPYWKTLRDWVDQYRKHLEDRRLLEILAENWQADGASWFSNLLARGRQLQDFGRVSSAISERAGAYLSASRQLQGLRYAALGVLVALIAAAGYGSWWTIENETNLRVASRLLAVKVGFASLAPPTMVPIEGEGSPDETPRHRVTVPAFAISRYEVTFDDYDVFVFDTGALRPPDLDWGRGRRPVIHMSWYDPKAYVDWLSKVTGVPYRLPSEAEWEYAARAGTTTPFALPAPDGSYDIEDMGLANCDGCGSEWGGRQTAPVGSFAANKAGLHDTAGNVWEWIEDCWHDSYEGGAPDNGRAWLQENGGNCGRRVLRGGSWIGTPEDLRSASRLRGSTVNRVSFIGFRVARTLSRSESVTP